MIQKTLSFILLISVLGCTDSPIQNNDDNNGFTSTQLCVRGERSCKDKNTLQTCVDGTQFVLNLCLDNEICDDNDCVPNDKDCNDKCDPPDTKCDSSGKVETCADHDSNGCFEFGAAIACAAGAICDPDDGLCKPNDCTDLCQENETTCEEDLITTCGRSANGCLEFQPGKECPDSKACLDGACADANCTDECRIGEGVCSPDGKHRVCENGPQNCGVLAEPTSCPANQECKNGACVPSRNCQDICLAGEKVCIGNDLASCDVNSQGCLEFSVPTACPNTQTCENSNGVVGCVNAPQAGPVVINEVFYDAIGEDVRNGQTPTFIELRGPAGLDISNYVIELHNGKNGAIYESYTLPVNSKLDGNGFAVLIADNPDGFLGFALPFFTNVYDVLISRSANVDAMQNGPDGVVLKDDSGTKIDSLSYGAPEPQFFIGEGPCVDQASCHSAPDAISGRSVGRINGQDTDDNQADFRTFYPTPGIENSDLIINEAYFNEPGADTGAETFVELVSPITGWEDIPLDGYVLHAVNGFNGNDYIFTGLNPGVELEGATLNEVQDGYVVICNIDKAATTIINLCSVPYEGVDWQNGPDNLVLRFNGVAIDALGFGSFGANTTFVGEGSPKPFASTDAGKSLGRWSLADSSKVIDTNDNQTDFFVLDPTPGTTNPLPAP